MTLIVITTQWTGAIMTTVVRVVAMMVMVGIMVMAMMIMLVGV